MKQDEHLLKSLTDREWDILRGIGMGLSNADIADHLTLSPTTVKWYTRQLYSKLQIEAVTDKRQAAAEIAHRFMKSQPALSPSNLPADVLPFVGRSGEINLLCDQLRHPFPRLLTFVGLGGVGKTRLALHVARQMMPEFDDQVYFVPLQTVFNRDELLVTLAQNIGSPTDREDLLEGIVTQIGQRRVLLVLDNAEHLPSQLGCDIQLFIALLERTQRLKLIFTSRKRLGLSIETVFSVHGLSYPATDEDISEAISYDGIAYFVSVGQQVNLHWSPTAADLKHIMHICHSVDGLPLALLLAARAMVRLPLADIAERVALASLSLQADDIDVPVRQRRLTDVIQAMVRDLNETDRKRFAQLGLFSGQFRLSSARIAFDITDIQLERIIQCGLVEIAQPGWARLHPLVQQFAMAELISEGDMVQATQRFVMHHRRRLTEAKAGNIISVDTVDALASEWTHLLTAWRLALEAEDWESLSAMMEPLHLVAWRRCLVHTLIAAFEAVFTNKNHTEADPRFVLELELRLRHIKGFIVHDNNTDGLDTIIHRLLELDATSAAAFGLMLLGTRQRESGHHHEALATGHAALDAYASCDDIHGMAFVNLQLGIVQLLIGDPVAAQRHWKVCRDLNAEVGDPMLAAVLLHRQAWAAYRTGWLTAAPEAALVLLDEARSLSNQLVDREMIGGVTQLASIICFNEGETELAAEHRETSLCYYRWAQDYLTVRYLLGQSFYSALLAHDYTAARAVIRQIGSDFDAEAEPHIPTFYDELSFVMSGHLPTADVLVERLKQLRKVGVNMYAFTTAMLLLARLSQSGAYDEVLQGYQILEHAAGRPKWLLDLPAAVFVASFIGERVNVQRLVTYPTRVHTPIIDWHKQLIAVLEI